MNPFRFYLLTDTHYFEPSLGAEGKAFDAYMAKEQYFMKESSAIIKTVFEKIAEDKETDIVIIPGDLSKNGEIESHKSFIKELYKLKASGKKIFVITAGHDYNDRSFAYKNDERIEVEGTAFEKLYDMYRDFGYGDALAFDKRTHSYIAQIADGVRMLAINCDSFNNLKGAMDDELLCWSKEQLDKAKEDNCRVFAICHYPVIPSVPVFDLVGDAKIKDWRKVAAFLADNGVEVIFTGHMHIQSINEFYSEKGNRLIDICTSCLVGSPAKYRKITIDENSVMNVKSIDVTDTGTDTDGLSAQEFFDRQFANAILMRISNALSGGKVIVKALKRLGKKAYEKADLRTLSKILFIPIDPSLKSKKLTELIAEIGLCIFKGDQPYVEGTPEYDMINRFLKKFSFIIKKIEPKLSKSGAEIDLTQMILSSVGNTKGFSDSDAEIKLK